MKNVAWKLEQKEPEEVSLLIWANFDSFANTYRM